MKGSLRWPVLALTLAIIALSVGGAWLYHTQGRRLRQAAEEELQTVARLKVDQIAAWRAERLGDAAVLGEDPFLGASAAQWLAEPRAESAEGILAHFRSVQTHYRYSDILLVDLAGTVCLNLSGRSEPLHPEAAQALAAALRERRPVLTDLHTDGAQAIHLGAVAPIFGQASAPVGAVILVSDARQFLYPLIQSWPVPSESAETLLVRRDGDDVLYLNELRHRRDTALKLRIPLSRADTPSVMAVSGRKGVVQGRDYRGVEVLAALEAIPDSPWFMVAKEDAAEAFAAWRARSASILMSLVILAALAGVTALLGWQWGLKARYRALYRAEAALRATEARYSVTLRSIGDAVIVTDERGRVELLNPVAERLTGWAEKEARGRPLEEVFRIVNEETRQPVESPVARVLREGLVVGLANHSLLIARDGSECPIADSGAPIRDEKGQISGVVLVFRDQTEERAAQRALRQSEERYRLLSEMLSDYAYAFRVEADGSLTREWVIGGFERVTGFTPQELEARGGWRALIYPEDMPIALARSRRLLAGEDDVSEFRIVRKDGEVRWLRDHGHPVWDEAQGRVVRIYGAAEDITEHKRMEEELHQSEARLQALFRAAPIGIGLVAPPPERRLLEANDNICRMLGYTREELIGQSARMLYPSDEDFNFVGRVKYAQIRERGVGTVETRWQRKDGSILDVLLSSALLDPADPAAGTVFTALDITERKRMEEALERARRDWEEIFQAIGHPSFILSPEGDILAANRAALQLARLPEEMLGQKCYRIFHGTDAPPAACPFRAMLASGRWESAEMEILEAGRLFLVSCTPVYDGQGRLEKVIHIATDISEQKRAQQALQEAQEAQARFVGQLQALIEVSNELLGAPNLDTFFRRAVELGRERLGFDRLGIWLFDEEKQEMVGTFGTDESGHIRDERGIRRPLDISHLGTDSLERLVPPVVRTDAPLPNEKGEEVGRGWHIIAPLWDGKRIVGTLSADNLLRQEPLSVYQAELLELYGSQLGHLYRLKRTEEELRLSEQRYRAVAEAAHAGISIVDEHENIIYANQALANMLGYGVEELVGMNLSRLADAEEYARYVQMTALRKMGMSSHYETTVRRKDGTPASLLVSAAPLTNPEGQFLGTLAVSIDITERKRAEEALRHEQALLQTLMDSAPDFIFFKDRRSRYLRTNLAHARSLGLENPADAVGKTDFDFFPAEQAAQLFEEEQRIMASGEPMVNREREVLYPDGRRRWVSSTKVPFRDEAGQVAGLVGLVRDRTAHRQLEAQFLQAQKMEPLGRLAGGVAHDFNNLLTAIVSYTDMLLNDPELSERARSDLQQVSQAAQQATALTRQLLTFSRRQVMQPENLDLNELVRDTEKMLGRLIGEDIRLVTRLDPALSWVRVDPGQINQVIVNLAVNARDAMPRGGTLTLETRNVRVKETPQGAIVYPLGDAAEAAQELPPPAGIKPGDYVMLAVEDTGVGMDDETQSHLFEPFFTTKEHGTGLGLSTVYGIVTQSGGYIHIQSEVGRGTTVRIYLPVVQRSAEAKAEAPAPAQVSRGSETILVVEDNRWVRELAVRVLAAQGYAVLHAESGEEALRLCREQGARIALLLTDVIMPGMNGRELARRIRETCPQVKVLYMSGYTDSERVEQSLLEGDAAFLQKPFTPESLARKVREVLARGS